VGSILDDIPTVRTDDISDSVADSDEWCARVEEQWGRIGVVFNSAKAVDNEQDQEAPVLALAATLWALVNLCRLTS
jgi:NAD(P)-dependent dehydrogenase (short-subunit alcohol dehydrogenase family)